MWLRNSDLRRRAAELCILPPQGDVSLLLRAKVPWSEAGKSFYQVRTGDLASFPELIPTGVHTGVSFFCSGPRLSDLAVASCCWAEQWGGLEQVVLDVSCLSPGWSFLLHQQLKPSLCWLLPRQSAGPADDCCGWWILLGPTYRAFAG